MLADIVNFRRVNVDPELIESHSKWIITGIPILRAFKGGGLFITGLH